jgi:hypothetical protein
VLPTPCPATRNLSFLRFHRHRHPVVLTCCFTVLVPVHSIRELKIYCTNAYGHVTPGLWCMLCSVYAKGAYCFPTSFAHGNSITSRGKPVSSQINEKLADIFNRFGATSHPTLIETVRHCASSTRKFLRPCACGHSNRIGLGATSHQTERLHGTR